MKDTIRVVTCLIFVFIVMPLTYLGGLLVFFRRMASTIESDWWSANFVHLIEPSFFIPVFIFMLVHGVYILDKVLCQDSGLNNNKGTDRFFFVSYGLFVLYFIIGVDNMFIILQQVSEILITMTVLFGFIAMAFSNYFRFMQAQEYGVSFRMTRHSVYESANVFVIVTLILGANIAFPIFIVFSDVPNSIVWIVFSMIIGTMVNILTIKMKTTRFTVSTIILQVLFSFVAAIAYSYASETEVLLPISGAEFAEWVVSSILSIIGSLGVIGSCFLTLLIFKNYTSRKILIRSTSPHESDIAVTFADSPHGAKTMYFIAMRYSSDKWIMMPCELGTDQVIRFTKGEFIVRGLDGLVVKRGEYKKLEPR